MARTSSDREPLRLRRGRAPRATPVAAALLLLAACDPYVQGNGVFREERRSVGAFHGVAVAEELEASVRAGVAERAVVVSGDENVVQYVETKVDAEGVLQLGMSGGVPYDSIHRLRVRVEVPELDLLRATGESTIGATEVVADRLAVHADRASVVTLSGTGGTSLDAVLAGGARLDASAYPVPVADVALSGGAQAKLLAANAITGTASGASAIENAGEGVCAVVLTDGATCSGP